MTFYLTIFCCRLTRKIVIVAWYISARSASRLHPSWQSFSFSNRALFSESTLLLISQPPGVHFIHLLSYSGITTHQEHSHMPSHRCSNDAIHGEDTNGSTGLIPQCQDRMSYLGDMWGQIIFIRGGWKWYDLVLRSTTSLSHNLRRDYFTGRET